MKKYFVCLLVAIAIASAVYYAINRPSVDNNGVSSISARDDNGTIINGQNPIDEPTKVVPPSTVNGGNPFPSEPGEPWLPPEDLLTEEEKEFRQQLIAAAGLDPDDPDLEQKLLAFYSATDSTQFPNAETYRLMTDRRLKEINSESDDRKVPKDLTKGIQSYTDENGVKHGIKNDDPGPGPNVNNGAGSYVEPTSARAALTDEATI